MNPKEMVEKDVGTASLVIRPLYLGNSGKIDKAFALMPLTREFRRVFKLEFTVKSVGRIEIMEKTLHEV